MQQLQIQDELYVSYSQIFTYQSCPLKYKFQYVEQRSPERISSNLFFGKSIHAALEFYYREVKEIHTPPQLERVLDVFQRHLTDAITASAVPVIYKKEAPGLDSLLTMGEGLLKVFCEHVDIAGYEILGIELPLSAPLYTAEGRPLDMKLFGIVDLLLKDSSGLIQVIDNKTSKQAKSQSAVDEDLQFTVYSYLLACNGYAFPRAKIQCRMDVLRKTKSPCMEHSYTTRSAEDRKRLCKVTEQVLAGIENRIFYPVKGWLCADCQYRDACRAW